MTSEASICNTGCRCITCYMLWSPGQDLPDTTDTPPYVVEGVYAQLQVCVRRVQTQGRPSAGCRRQLRLWVWVRGQGSGPGGIPLSA